MSKAYVTTKHWKAAKGWKWIVHDLGLAVRQGTADDERSAVLRANNAKQEYLASLARYTRQTPIEEALATTG